MVFFISIWTQYLNLNLNFLYMSKTSDKICYFITRSSSYIINDVIVYEKVLVWYICAMEIFSYIKEETESDQKQNQKQTCFQHRVISTWTMFRLLHKQFRHFSNRIHNLRNHVAENQLKDEHCLVFVYFWLQKTYAGFSHIIQYVSILW